MNISASQTRWFRFRRSGLGEPFATPAETARHLIGVQAQMPAAANVAFFNRTGGVSPDSLAHERLETRSVFRLWGQRNTAHIYAADDWPLLYTVFRDRGSVTTRRMEKSGLLTEFRRLVKRMEQRLAAGERLTYKDAASRKLKAVPPDVLGLQGLTEVQDGWVVSYAAFRQLVRDGVVCHGPDQGGESTFVHRHLWLPDLDWAVPDEETAFVDLACRYLATYGPAAPRDLAYWFGTTVTNARRWVAAAGERIANVVVEGQPAVCRTDDLGAVAEKPPAPSKWPVKLLYRFDPLLLATKDKNWLIERRHKKQVWRPGGHVNAVILVGGRIVGTWRYDKRAKGLVISVTPFEPLSRAVARAVETQARAVARFMGLDLLELTNSGR